MGDRELFNQPEWGRKLSCCCLIPQRVVLAIMGFLCVVCCYLPNIGMSHAITVFTVKKHINKTKDDGCSASDEFIESHEMMHKGEFKFSEKEQGMILSAFYIGYILTHIPGGYLADKYGGKWVLFIGLFIAMISTALTPSVAYLWSFYGLILIRFILGFAEGVLYPAVSSWLSNWIPQNELGKLAGLVLGGNILGSVVVNALSGFILDRLNWPIMFYIYAAVIGVWLISVVSFQFSRARTLRFVLVLLCSVLVCYPVDHPCIKEKEVEYLRQELGHIGPLIKPPTPWKAILTSVPVWAMIIGHAGHDWGLYVMIVDLPKYMSDVLKMSPTKNGLASALPFIFMWIVLLISGFIGDAIIKSGFISINHYRKVMTNIAAILPGIFMILASYAGCAVLTAVIMFCLALAAMGCFYTGLKLSPIDMSPNNAGILTALSNGMGAVTGFVAPNFIGIMTPNTTVLEWRLVFCTSFIILVSTSLIYTIWGQSVLQPFDSAAPLDKQNN